MFVSIGWWFFSVVVVGILINIASNYLFPLFDNQLKKYSDTRLNSSLKKQAELETRIALMGTDPHYFNWYCSELNNVIVIQQLTFAMLVVIGAVIGSFGNYTGSTLVGFQGGGLLIFILFLGNFLCIGFFLSSRIAARMRATIRAYWKKKNIDYRV